MSHAAAPQTPTKVLRNYRARASGVAALAVVACGVSEHPAPGDTRDAAVVPGTQTVASGTASNPGASAAASSLSTAIPLPDAAPPPSSSGDVDAQSDAAVVHPADAAGDSGVNLDAGLDAADAFPAVDAAGAADGAVNSCTSPLPLGCGDRLEHDTRVQGRPNVWPGYNTSARYESGPETIYVLETPTACQVETQLGVLSVDLDLFLLTSCEMWHDSQASSTPLDIQTVETLSFATEAEQPYFIVVDGYDGDAGTYTLTVHCTCD